MMQKIISFLIICSVITISAHAQQRREIGAEFQRSFGKGYSGNMAGPRYESYKNKNSFNIGLTYHFPTKKSFINPSLYVIPEPLSTIWLLP